MLVGGCLASVPITGLSCGTETCFFFNLPVVFSVPTVFAFPFDFFSFVGFEVAGGGVLSRVGTIGYSMENCYIWFEPLPDLRECPEPKLAEALWLGGNCIVFLC